MFCLWSYSQFEASKVQDYRLEPVQRYSDDEDIRWERRNHFFYKEHQSEL